MATKIDTFWQWVEKRMEELQITSYRDLAKKAGLSPATITNRKSECKPPTIEIAEGLCHALRVDWVELWTRAGYVDQFGPETVNPRVSDLKGLDAQIYQTLQGTSEEFKLATLKTIKTWLVIQDELKK
jgi:transcriptional regulator with XRE-family HTH domain